LKQSKDQNLIQFDGGQAVPTKKAKKTKSATRGKKLSQAKPMNQVKPLSVSLNFTKIQN